MDFIGLGVVVLLAILFAWLTVRAWRIKSSTLRWLAVIPAGIVTLATLGLLGAALNGYAKFNAQHNNPVQPVTVASTPEQLERGRVLARACAGCHAPDGNLPLVGDNFGESGPPLGTLWAPPLTAAHFNGWSDGEIVRAIREGVHQNGRSLLIMPAASFHSMSDEDVHSIVAFIRSHTPDAPEAPPTQLSLMGALLLNVAPFQSVQPPVTGPVAAPPRGPTAEYGDYLLTVGGCRECHAANLAGTPPGSGPPPGPNITTVAQEYNEQQFIRLFREGIKEDGTPLGEEMPYRDYELFTDDDFRAMFAYLQGVAPLPDNQP